MPPRLLVLVVVLAATAMSEAAEQPAAVFPLMAWNSPPLDPAVFAEMRECGLTIAGFVPPSGLDMCHAAGLKAIVFDPRTSGYDWLAVDAKAARSQVESLVKEVRNHPAVYGYNLRDEPSVSFFPGLAVVSNAVKEFHPGAWPYINMFPNYAHPGTLGAADYDAYLEKFIEVCQPPILSYDHYALMEGGGLREEYFANLESVRRAGLKHNIPTWNIVLTASHFNYREVTAADLRFQVYTSLAYGMRGIGYFTYFTAPQGNHRQGPIDQFGHKTATWDALRQVNLQVANLARTMLKLRSDRVYHLGDVPKGCTAPDDQSLVTGGTESLVVGEFTHEDGSRYLMAVNKKVKGSVVCNLKYRQAPAKVEHVSPYYDGVRPFEGEDIWLAPGGAALLKITP